jgi:CubicO group peptidase (beta-lactamase class C family)
MNFRASIVLGYSLFAFGCSDAEPTPAGPDAPLAESVQDRIDEAVAEGFSGAILVTVDGERLVASGHGLADRENETPNTEATAFDVGSIMKEMTATALFVLVEEGMLDLSDPLRSVFPDVPPDKADITLLEILQHRAGFDEYHDTTGDFEAMTREEAREHIFAQALLFPPGTDEAYSNSGFTLLADVVQTVSGIEFTDDVHSVVFEPAGMDHSGFYSEELWQSVDTAIGYDAETFGDNDPATWPYTWSLVGNGGLVTTVIDLERWLLALWEGRLLSAETFETMRTEYLEGGSGELAGETAYAGAGAGDFGLGGVAIDVPARQTRVIVATNTYEVFDIESFALDLTTEILESD